MNTTKLDARASMFGRLAMESGLVTHEELVACIEEQERFRVDGQPAPKLGELLVEKDILTRDEVNLILRMQSNPTGLLGRKLVEKGLVTRQQLRECLDEQADLLRSGVTPPRLGEMLVEKGLVKQEDLQALLKKTDTASNLFGEFLIANKLVKESDINKCLLMQKEAADKGGKPQRLGELLVSCGILRKEQMELYSRRHMQGRRLAAQSVAPVTARKEGAKRVKGDFEILDTLGQHVDGMTCKVRHVPSGAIVAAHFFNAQDEPVEAESVDVEMVRAKGAAARISDAPPPVDAFAEKRRNVVMLRHPAAQAALSNEIVNGQQVLVADYIEGTTLESIVAAKGNIDWLWGAEMLHEFTEALIEAGRLGLVHDDIRPGSVLVDTSGHARLGLWAYTRDPVANRDWVARKHHPLGFYFAPERITGGPSAKADMFSLGLTIARALTGAPPPRGNSAAETAEQYNGAEIAQELAIDMALPLELVSILTRMIDPDPNARFAGHAEALKAIHEFMEGAGMDADAAMGRGDADAAVQGADDAEKTIAKFLQTDMTQRTAGKVSFGRMLRFFSLPVAAMFVIMLGMTIAYKNSQSSHGLMVRANWLDQQGDKAGALNLYRMISVLYPKNEVIQQRYYDLAMEVKDHGEAEIALEQLMALHPEKRGEYLETQADLQVWQKRFRSAADLYKEVLAARPHDLKLKGKLANALLWAHEYPEAERAFNELADLEPGDNEMLLGYARAAAGAKDVAVAARSFQRLFTLNLLSESSLMEYGWLLSDAKRADDLRDMAKEALERKESEDYSLRNLTYLNYWAGDYGKALAALDRLPGGGDDDKESLMFRINIHDHLGNSEAAIKEYGQLAALEPNNPDYPMNIGRLYQARGNFEKADASFRQALARREGDPDIRRAIAENLTYMNKPSESIKWFREVLTRNPDDKEAMSGLVQALLSDDRYSEAQTYAERIYQDNPRDRTARYNLALVYVQLGRAADATPLIDSLLADGSLNAGERDRLAFAALNADSNELLLRLIGGSGDDNSKITELRLLLARRMRGQGKHNLALPLYAAVLAATPNPDPKLLMEMAETANWAGRHDIAARWLEQARAIAAARETGVPARSAPDPSLRLPQEAWDSLLKPLAEQKGVYDSLSGLQTRYGVEKQPAIAASPAASGSASASKYDLLTPGSLEKIANSAASATGSIADTINKATGAFAGGSK